MTACQFSTTRTTIRAGVSGGTRAGGASPKSWASSGQITSGVKVPITVVGHGVDDIFAPGAEVRSSGTFDIITSFSGYSFPRRKGLPELVEAFCEAFRGRSDVRLRIRSHPTEEVREIVERSAAGSQITLETLRWGTPDRVAWFLRSGHVLAHPSRAEGFGLLALQGMACGMPVVSTAVSGLADFVSTGRAIVVRSGPLEPGYSWDNQPGMQHSVDVAHLAECLSLAHREFSSWSAFARTNARNIREDYSWLRVLAPLKTVVDQFLELSTGQELPNTSGQDCGQP